MINFICKSQTNVYIEVLGTMKPYFVNFKLILVWADLQFKMECLLIIYFYCKFKYNKL